MNYFFGREQSGFFRVFDTYVTVTPTSALTLGLDVNHTSNELLDDDPALALDGIGGYVRYQVTAPFAAAIRYEYLDDEGLFGGIDQTLQETTLTLEYKMSHAFLVRTEFRRDWSSEDFFPSPDGSTDLRSHQNTLLFGGIWVIGNKTGAW